MRQIHAIEPLLERVADSARQICGSDWSGIGLLVGHGDGARIQQWVTSPRELSRDLGVGIELGLPGSGESAPPVLHRDVGSGEHSWVAGTMASLAVPVVVDQRPEALLCVGRRSLETFTPREEGALHWLADHAATALLNTRLLDEANRWRRDAEELAMLSQLLSQSLDAHEVATRIVDSVRRLLGGLTCVLYGVDLPPGHGLQPLAASGISRDRVPPQPADVGAVGLALREQRVVSTPDLLGDPRVHTTPALREYLRETDHGAVLALPLIAGARPIGVLAVSGHTSRLWSADEFRLARIFADHATIALENARVFAESQRQRRAAEALALLARATSQSLDISVLGQQIVDALLRLLDAARIAFFAREPATGRLRLMAVARRLLSADAGDVAHDEPGPVEVLAIRDRRLVATRDFLAEPGMAAAGAHPGRDGAPVRAVVAMPLLHVDHVIGVLSVGDHAGREFDPEEVEILRTAADHAAVALQNARLHAQVAEAARVRERVRIARELHDTLGQLAFSVGLKLDWCLHRIAPASPVTPKLEAIRRDTGLMMAQIRQLIGHLSLDGAAEASFARQLEALLAEFRELTGIPAELALDGDPGQLTPPIQDALRKTLQEALVNIAKHAEASQVTVRLTIGADRAVLEVVDDGVGLPADVAELMASRPDHLGLQQMRERIEGVGGELEISGRPGAGVRIRGALPLA